MDPGNRGFTLPQLLIALTITTMIGLAAGGVSMALSSAYEYGEDYHRSIQYSRAVMRRMHSVVSGSRLITAAGTTSMALWVSDANDNGVINITELLLVKYDSSGDQVSEYRIVFPSYWPDELKNVLNFQVSLNWCTSITNVTNYLTGWYYSQETVLADEISGFSVSPSASGPMSKMVEFTIQAGAAGRTLTLTSAASLRADWLDHVGISGGDYVLDTE